MDARPHGPPPRSQVRTQRGGYRFGMGVANCKMRATTGLGPGTLLACGRNTTCQPHHTQDPCQSGPGRGAERCVSRDTPNPAQPQPVGVARLRTPARCVSEQTRTGPDRHTGDPPGPPPVVVPVGATPTGGSRAVRGGWHAPCSSPRGSRLRPAPPDPGTPGGHRGGHE